VAGRDAPPEVLWRKNLALLIYLALSPSRTRTREHLVGILWPETNDRLARKSLTEAVRRLRTSLGAGRLLSHGDAITLDAAALDVDALRFEAATARDPRGAAELFSGDFLEGFSLPDAPGFDEWAASERARHRAKGAQVLAEEGERALAASRFGEAQEFARRALALAPFAERAARLVMRAAALAGDSTSALHAYHEYSGRLKAELAESPSDDLRRLAERVRGGRWRRVSATAAGLEPPLVGRPDLAEALFTALSEGVRHGPRTLLISGDAGLGKSRLLAECTDRLMLEGAHVARLRPLESDHDAPWSMLRALIRAGLLEAPGVAAAKPDGLAVLASLVPELAERAAPRLPKDRTEVADAFASLVEAVAQEGPIGLAIDDAHFADGASLEALPAALGRLKALPVVLVITSARLGEDLPPALLRLHSEIGRSLPGLARELTPLSSDDVRALTATLAPWCQTAREGDRLARRITFESAGNPFLAVTLLRGLADVASLRPDATMWPPPSATFEAPLPLSIPNLARAGIVARVARLDTDVRRVLVTASVLGVRLDLDLLAQVVDRPRAWVEQQLPALERANLVTFDGERYAFAAPLLAQAVRAEFLTSGERRALCRQAAAALAGRPDLASRALRLELLTELDPGEGAFLEATTVARMALAEGATRTARRALVAAEHALGRLGNEERLEVASLRAELAASTAPRTGGRGG